MIMSILTEKNAITFEILQQADIELTAACISTIMSKYEPITKALQISEAEFYSFVIPYCHKAVKESVSLIAKDKQTGDVVGFIISEDLMIAPPDALETLIDKFEPVFHLLDELESVYKNKNSISQGEVLHIFLLGVLETYANKNIAKTLVRENLKLAKQRNLKFAIVEATGLVSQHIFSSFDFQEEATIEYKAYKFNNKNILSTVENSEKCILMSAKI